MKLPVILVLTGVVLILSGLLLAAAERFLGRLPGDILVQRDGFTLYVPLGAMLVLSLLLTLLLNIVPRFFR